MCLSFNYERPNKIIIELTCTENDQENKFFWGELPLKQGSRGEGGNWDGDNIGWWALEALDQ